MIPDENIYGIETEIPMQLLNFVFRSGPGNHHGKISATDCTALLADIVLARLGITLLWFDSLLLDHVPYSTMVHSPKKRLIPPVRQPHRPETKARSCLPARLSRHRLHR